jgi:hypothetical protein
MTSHFGLPCRTRHHPPPSPGLSPTPRRQHRRKRPRGLMTRHSNSSGVAMASTQWNSSSFSEPQTLSAGERKSASSLPQQHTCLLYHRRHSTDRRGARLGRPGVSRNDLRYRRTPLPSAPRDWHAHSHGTPQQASGVAHTARPTNPASRSTGVSAPSHMET